MRTIQFKSTPENFKKEYLNLKRCTVRTFDEEDDVRKEILNYHIKGVITKLQVEITNAIDKGESFIRTVTDVTYWDNRYIISW